MKGGSEMNDGALSGLKIVELGEFISAPHCGKLLADSGADVIKIEKPGFGDKARDWGPFPQDIPHPEKSGLFLYLNTNKRGVTLNLNSAVGINIFKELVKWADVLVENCLPQDTEKMGIDYKTLHQINPALVVTSITYFGQTGPYRGYKACDLISLHTSAEAYVNPLYEVYDPEHDPPLKLPGHSGDFLGGLTGAICTMSAIFAQQTSGVGQHVDLSQQEALAWIISREAGDYFDSDIHFQRDRKFKWENSPKYACKDGYIMMVITDQFWNGLLEMMGNPNWANEDAFQTPVSRVKNLAKSQPKIAEWMKKHTVAEVESAARTQHLPFSVIHSVKEVTADEMFTAREFFVDIDHKVAGKIRFPGAPCKFSATPSKIKRPAPLLGEHNYEVYCQMLGYSPKNLVKMKQTGAI